MTLELDDPEIAVHASRLAPYARRLLARSGEHALRLHADLVVPEHLLSTLMADESSAAHAAVLHAFADPTTIAEEALAISPGLMVVASGSTLPFSPRAVAVLARARESSGAPEAREILVADLFGHAADAIEAEVLEALLHAGLAWEVRAAYDGPAPPLGSALFKRFSAGAKRALSGANRLAAEDSDVSISPSHLLLACLREDEGLADRHGIGFHRARTVLRGRTHDATEVVSRRIPAAPDLVAFLVGLPPASDSLSLLGRFLDGGTPEAAQILLRSKVTRELLERVRDAFRDPDEPSAEGPPRRSGKPEL